MKKTTLRHICVMVLGMLGPLLWSGVGCRARCPVTVPWALKQAGENRGELERVLEHYRRTGEKLKLRAARFLIANLKGHGYILATYYDADHHEVPFNALDYPDYATARAALDALEKEHGTLDYGRKQFDADLQTITADYLIENIDLAFQAWRERPWARGLSFEAFCQYVLPYRGSNEPVNSWRAACRQRYADLPAKMQDPHDAQEAASLIEQDARQWVRFNDLYYLHPTDQGFDEMNRTRQGRCEDMTNMMLYALRANAIACTSDYTPYWADRDNNHAWEVVLDAQGHGSAKLFSRAAKVYRKTFAIQRDNLACIKGADEKVPRWLSGKNYLDVTPQYMETTDVTLTLEQAPPPRAHFAYLCVFNGGEWKAIHWGKLHGRRVTFTRMGRNIAYLPAYYVDQKLQPAGPPFILTKKGQVRTLDGQGAMSLEIELAATTPETRDADTQSTHPTIVVQPGKTYELFAWDRGWKSCGKQMAGGQPVSFENVSGGRLYWLVAEGSRRLERIFTIEDGQQAWW